MKLISIGEGILVAAVLALLVIPIRFASSLFFLGWGGVKFGLGIIVISYVLYLLSRKKVQTGKFFIGLLTVLWVLGSTVMYVSPLTLLVLHVGYLWFVRCVLSYKSLIPCFLDGILSVLSLSFAASSFVVTGSLMVSVWVFFLMQSVHVLIGGVKRSKTVTAPDCISQELGFDRAMRTAEAALSQIR